MPKKSTCAVTWTRTPPLEQATFAQTVATNVYANPTVFAKPAVDKKVIDDTAADLVAKFANRLNGPVARQLFKDAKTKINTILHDMAEYVDEVANGDVNIIILAGFTPTDTARHPLPQPGQPIATVTPHAGRHLDIRLLYTGAKASFVTIVGEDHDPKVEVSGDHISIAPGTGVVHIITDGNLHEDIQVSNTADKVFIKSLAQNATGKSAFSSTVSTKVLE